MISMKLNLPHSPRLIYTDNLMHRLGIIMLWMAVVSVLSYKDITAQREAWREVKAASVSEF